MKDNYMKSFFISAMMSAVMSMAFTSQVTAQESQAKQRCASRSAVFTTLREKNYEPLIVATDDETNLGYVLLADSNKMLVLVTVIDKETACIAAISRIDEIAVSRASIVNFIN